MVTQEWEGKSDFVRECLARKTALFIKIDGNKNVFEWQNKKIQ